MTSITAGPPIPEAILIQRRENQRTKRGGEASEEAAADQQENTKQQAAEDDSDDDFGPQLASASTADTEQEEEAALERLRQRESEERIRQEAEDRASGKRDMAARENWMAFALGQKEDKGAKYDAKTMRRIAGSSSLRGKEETESQRTKRMADEMMGLSNNQESSKKPKKEPEEEEDEYFVARRNEPSLLDQHLQKRQEEKRSKKNKRERERFDWERDMKSGGLSSNKVQKIVSQAQDMASRFSRGKK